MRNYVIGFVAGAAVMAVLLLSWIVLAVALEPSLQSWR